MAVTLNPLKSTALSGYHYDPSTSVLTVEFTGGKRWRFNDVPMEKAEALGGSASPGAFFGRKIRGLYSGHELA